MLLEAILRLQGNGVVPAPATRRLYEYFGHRKQHSKAAIRYAVDGKSCNCINLAWSDPGICSEASYHFSPSCGPAAQQNVGQQPTSPFFTNRR